MRRRLFNIASAVSLLLCVAIGVLWARSYWHTDIAWVPDCRVQTFDGRLYFSKMGCGPEGAIHLWSRELAFGPFFGDDLFLYEAADSTRFSGLRISRGVIPFTGVPFWMLLAIGGIPLWLWIFRMTYKQPRPGMCSACSYNLTGNTSGVCPECGTALNL